MAVNGAVIDAVNTDMTGRLLVSDIFAGGGVIPLAAVMRGHQVYAQDLNPWAADGLSAMLGLPAPKRLQDAAATLANWVHGEVQAAYGTTLSDGTTGHVSHTFRVATSECTACRQRARMFPYALVSLLARRERGEPAAFLACPRGHLFKGDSNRRCACPECNIRTDPAEAYTPGRKIVCWNCGHIDRLEARAETWDWEVVLVERSRRGHRELAIPTNAEREAADGPQWSPTLSLGKIPDGQETRVLLRHSFEYWEQLYPNRQRVLMERLLDAVQHCSQDPAVVRAITTCVIGSAEMAGNLSRWDRYYLKSYESMAGHRFNLTTFAVEPNVWGTQNSGRGTVLRRLAQLLKAASWLNEKTGRALMVDGPVAATDTIADRTLDADVRVVEGSSERLLLPDSCVHLTLTDPPYHDDVQYSELSLPLRAWAKLADGQLIGEAVVNAATGQLADDGAYEDILARIFTETRRTLRGDGHLIFSYANRSPQAWVALFSALQRAGLRAIGCEIVHSENETDHAKRGVRACTRDLLMDLVPVGNCPIEQHRPRVDKESDEVDFLKSVSEDFLLVGNLKGDWQEEFHLRLSETSFLQNLRSRVQDEPE
ncbi:hypothetical protein [Sciscionella marina]|uniref:hypothetical protein n=1 Tax=Sciscionella marina TaxID=508770 RepID=UPI001F0956EE|nr:hypothetical protein [Sciscionella marina]